MKLHPPPVVNKQVTADMLHWVMQQPNTVMFNTVTSEFTITPGKGAQDYVVDNKTRAIIIKEFRDILIHNGFGCEYAYRNMLEISKGKWSMRLNLIGQIPFPDYLPHQINKAYECWKYEQGNLDRAMRYERGGFDYRLYEAHLTGYNSEGINRIAEDSIDEVDKLDPEALKAFDDANLSIGQIWTPKKQGCDIRITYLGRNVAGVKFEELGSGKIGAPVEKIINPDVFLDEPYYLHKLIIGYDVLSKVYYFYSRKKDFKELLPQSVANTLARLIEFHKEDPMNNI